MIDAFIVVIALDKDFSRSARLAVLPLHPLPGP
jgi:hypothetical protein